MCTLSARASIERRKSMLNMSILLFVVQNKYCLEKTLQLKKDKN